MYVRRLADEMRLTGEVWNRRDGRVECVAFHEDPNHLDDFCRSLWDGPGEVRDVTESVENRSPWMEGFEIVASR
jgi:acylphosphatase